MEFKYDISLIRNFSIIAHIDHGKSTLADRLLERATLLRMQKSIEDQFLDDMELEKERGITIKARPVTMYYDYQGKVYQINLIDTPGHVDFSYEVSRSLSACEGALLVVDASQGVQAQTMANLFLALEKDLFILPVFNKIDLDAASIEDTRNEIETIIGIDTTDACGISAKSGLGIDSLLASIICNIPPPKKDGDKALKALVFDSHYDPYRGVFVYIRLMAGTIKAHDKILFMAQDSETEVLEVGVFSPKECKVDCLRAGEVGYIVSNIKNPREIKIGDTVTLKNSPTKKALSGFKNVQPTLFASIYTIDSSRFNNLKEALFKLQLNDSALSIEQEHSLALGLGFRCGFLGTLHLEITIERLTREFDLDLITTAPSIPYKFFLNDGSVKTITNPMQAPDMEKIDYVEEPLVISHVLIPAEYIGAVMNIAMDIRGSLTTTETVGANRILLTYLFPLNELIGGFGDQLKAATKGYGSFDYEFHSYAKSDIVKLEVRLNSELVEAFTYFVHRSKAVSKGKAVCAKLKEIVPRQLFKIPIQAMIGVKVVARETLSALKKDVTAKCYGGDITRKRKLLEKQKKGKKRMKEIGKVSIPQSAFIAVLKSLQ